MRFLLLVLLMALAAAGLQLFLDWWACAIAVFVIALLLKTSSDTAFWAGFWAVGCLWFSYAFWLDYQTQSILSSKVMLLFKIPSPLLLLIVTGVLGAFVGGFAAITGSYCRKMLFGED